jgi:hypothetical protein
MERIGEITTGKKVLKRKYFLSMLEKSPVGDWIEGVAKIKAMSRV